MIMTNPEEVREYLRQIKCKEQKYHSLQGVQKTISEGEGSSTEIAMVGAYFLEQQGHQPEIINMITSKMLGVTSLKTSGTAVYQDPFDQAYCATGVMMPDTCVFGDGLRSQTMEGLAKMIAHEMEREGIQVHLGTATNMDNVPYNDQWRTEQSCAPLWAEIPRSKVIYEPNEVTKLERRIEDSGRTVGYTCAIGSPMGIAEMKRGPTGAEVKRLY